MPPTSLFDLDPFADDGRVRVVVETVKGARNKLSYDPAFSAFRLKKTLPAGMIFPYDFGFIPGTKGEDGDPLDALLLMPESVGSGTVVEGRLIGVITARQTEKGKSERNDRFIVVSEAADDYRGVRALADLPGNLLTELREFFVNYNRLEGRAFRPLGNRDVKTARRLIEKARKPS